MAEYLLKWKVPGSDVEYSMRGYSKSYLDDFKWMKDTILTSGGEATITETIEREL